MKSCSFFQQFILIPKAATLYLNPSNCKSYKNSSITDSVAECSAYLHISGDFVRRGIVKPQWNESENIQVMLVMVLKALDIVVNSTEQKAFSIAQQALLFLLINLTLHLQRPIISTETIVSVTYSHHASPHQDFRLTNAFRNEQTMVTSNCSKLIQYCTL